MSAAACEFTYDRAETEYRRPFTVGYLGVLAVWGMLFVVRPGLAMKVWRERRFDSPIARR